MPTPTDTAILERLLVPETGQLSAEVAGYFASLDFPPGDRDRMLHLTERAREGTLTPAERAELDSYERVLQVLSGWRARARRLLEQQGMIDPPAAALPEPALQIPPGIRRSQEALRRDLLQLLQNKKLFHQWVAYHGEERIGIARTESELVRECIRRGLAHDEYYVGWIDPCELVEEEELDPPPPDLCTDGEDEQVAW
jgi:hypothetical protein